ncbi:MAG: LCP family protein [Chloroflexi bacterium]|nr:LCP family protein [Chloroflexota bacterium]
MRFAMAGLLGLVVPGAGQAALGRRRAALLFFLPTAALVAVGMGLLLTRGITGVVAILVTPGVLPALALVNVLFALWRLAAVVDGARRTNRPAVTVGIVGTATLVLLVAPHAWLGWSIAAWDDLLNSTFADTDTGQVQPTDQPSAPGSVGGWVYPEPTGWDWPDRTPAPGATPAPPKRPIIPGSGTLPGLGVAVPWDRPGAVPWGSDGRFDLLLLGSDAGVDRWSRRMDVMLLVEVDVASGKVAMIGLPRNLWGAPFPPGLARDSVACGCFQNLLNAIYVEATAVHPNRWPGTGAVKGIGAARSMVGELTGRPIDAVLVADLWGVIKVVDAMGGVDIDVPAPVYDDHYPDPILGGITLSIRAGQQHLDGRLALAYARSRHQDSDYGRMVRQQTLLLAIRNQLGPATILNAPGLAAAAKGFVWTDLPRDSLPNLVDLFGRAQTASVKQVRIVPPTYPSSITPAEVVKIQRDIANLLGVPVPPTPSPVPSSSPSPTPSTVPSPVPSPSPSPSPAPSPVPSPSNVPTPLPTESPPAPTESPP